MFFDDSPVVGCCECGAEPVGITNYCKEHQAKNWHGWFAWFPVYTLDRQWQWLSTVIRKRIPEDYPQLRHVTAHWFQPTWWYRTPENW